MSKFYFHVRSSRTLKTWEKIALFLAAVLFVAAFLGLLWGGLALLLRFVWSWFAAAFGWPPMPLWVAFGVVVLLTCIFGSKSSGR